MKKIYSLLTIIAGLLYILTNSSCQKEYSCEDCVIRDIIPPRDTTIINDTAKIDSTLNFPFCNSCDSTKPLALNSWSFRTNNSYICGVVDSSLFDTEKYSFDFWGHLQCSRDTIFRIVSFFDPLQFNSDRFNESTTTQSFILQDQLNYMNPWNGYILRTDGYTTSHTIKVVVDTFINSTKLMVGRFYGYAYTKEFKKSYIDGKFRFTVR
ncbi:MAG: hypothetical protein Q8L07_08435 [Sediminibacterium sp.]|nr:hypothetical protein [Sediminibacterium sp.]